MIEAPIERKRPADKQVGLDWGMHENTIYTESSGDKHQIPDEIMSRVDQLEMKARKVQSEAQGVSPSRRAALLDRRRYLLAKRSNVMGQYYTSLANTLCSKYDLIAIEGVSPRGMRRRGLEPPFLRWTHTTPVRSSSDNTHQPPRSAGYLSENGPLRLPGSS